MSKYIKPNSKDLKDNLSTIRNKVFDHFSNTIENLIIEKEGKKYNARSFEINGLKILYRQAKITPTKIGQFVTLWKRIENGPIAPFRINDNIDFVIITTKNNDQLGLFLFPKSILIKKGIISTQTKEGKRGFRVYPPWDNAINKQAKKTQEWQLQYFMDLDNSVDIERVIVQLS